MYKHYGCRFICFTLAITGHHYQKTKNQCGSPDSGFHNTHSEIVAANKVTDIDLNTYYKSNIDYVFTEDKRTAMHYF
jgi:uncharacterized protein YecT (DUF1311 family)